MNGLDFNASVVFRSIHSQGPTTEEFERAAKRTLRDASILQACTAVIDAGYQDNDAEVSADGKTISIYAGGKWIPWPAFTVRYEAQDARTGSEDEPELPTWTMKEGE